MAYELPSQMGTRSCSVTSALVKAGMNTIHLRKSAWVKIAALHKRAASGVIDARKELQNSCTDAQLGDHKPNYKDGRTPSVDIPLPSISGPEMIDNMSAAKQSTSGQCMRKHQDKGSRQRRR